jgi:hypothetical protein
MEYVVTARCVVSIAAREPLPEGLKLAPPAFVDVEILADLEQPGPAVASRAVGMKGAPCTQHCFLDEV